MLLDPEELKMFRKPKFQACKRILAVFVLLGASPFVSSRLAVSQNLSNSEKLPVYVKLRGIDGKMYDVADMKGQVVLVSFGATWCDPCNEEVEALEELKAEYRDKPVRFIWVSVERKNQVSDSGLRAFSKFHKMSYTVLRDPTQLTYAQFSMRVRLPLVVFFDRNGKFAGPKHFGMSDPEDYKRLIRSQIDHLLTS
jgi:cytochrome c biogenesis protein CcmG/thiol:disulfide interchange protein DsbE